MHFTDLVAIISVVEATNILLVMEGCRPATYFVTKEDICQHLEHLLNGDSRVGLLIRKHSEKKEKNNVIVYNKGCFDHDQVVQLTSDASGMGRLLGYIASSDEMGIKSKYKIEYRVNGYQLYAQVCKFLDDNRKCKAEQQLMQYQDVSCHLGLEITLYCGERNLLQAETLESRRHHRIYKDRHALANRLDANFPQTASYLRIEDRQDWLMHYRRYRHLWITISRFNPEVAIPNLEMSLYQGWELRSKTRKAERNSNKHNEQIINKELCS